MTGMSRLSVRRVGLGRYLIAGQDAVLHTRRFPFALPLLRFHFRVVTREGKLVRTSEGTEGGIRTSALYLVDLMPLRRCVKRSDKRHRCFSVYLALEPGL